jgi:hypothetical protein
LAFASAVGIWDLQATTASFASHLDVSFVSALDMNVFVIIDNATPINIKLSFNYSRSLIKVVDKFKSAKTQIKTVFENIVPNFRSIGVDMVKQIKFKLIF